MYNFLCCLFDSWHSVSTMNTLSVPQNQHGCSTHLFPRCSGLIHKCFLAEIFARWRFRKGQVQTSWSWILAHSPRHTNFSFLRPNGQNASRPKPLGYAYVDPFFLFGLKLHLVCICVSITYYFLFSRLCVIIQHVHISVFLPSCANAIDAISQPSRIWLRRPSPGTPWWCIASTCADRTPFWRHVFEQGWWCKTLQIPRPAHLFQHARPG